jgi:hypothetical protein
MGYDSDASKLEPKASGFKEHVCNGKVEWLPTRACLRNIMKRTSGSAPPTKHKVHLKFQEKLYKELRSGDEFSQVSPGPHWLYISFILHTTVFSTRTGTLEF